MLEGDRENGGTVKIQKEREKCENFDFVRER